MVYFDQHVIVPPETEAFVQRVIFALRFVGILLALSIFTLALALCVLSYALWVNGCKQAAAHRNHQKLD